MHATGQLTAPYPVDLADVSCIVRALGPHPAARSARFSIQIDDGPPVNVELSWRRGGNYLVTTTLTDGDGEPLDALVHGRDVPDVIVPGHHGAGHWWSFDEAVAIAVRWLTTAERPAGSRYPYDPADHVGWTWDEMSACTTCKALWTDPTTA